MNVAIIPNRKIPPIVKIKFRSPSNTGFSVPRSGTMYSSIIFFVNRGAETDTTELITIQINTKIIIEK